MENLKDALEYVVDLKDNEEKIVTEVARVKNTTMQKRMT